MGFCSSSYMGEKQIIRRKFSANMLKRCARIFWHTLCYFILQPNMVAMVVGIVMYDVLELVVETYAEDFVGTAIDIGASECW